MSFSFSTRTTNPIEIDLNQFLSEVNAAFNVLLNQKNSVLPTIQFGVSENEFIVEIRSLRPTGGLRGFQYTDFLSQEPDGGYFLYNFNEYWDQYGNVPFYEFSIIELRRSRENVKVAVALAMIVAVAKCFSTDLIYATSVLPDDEYNGICLSELMSFSVVEDLSLDAAIQKLYENIKL